MSGAVGKPLLEVQDLSGGFVGPDGEIVPVLNGVSFVVQEGSFFAVVGESGSGKSLTALAALGVMPQGFRRTAGAIRFDGTDLLTLDEARLRNIRGSQISIVFQDARAALNPVFTVGQQIMDVCRMHQNLSHREARRKAEEMLDRVRVPEAKRRMRQYPHEFSGGMAQRALLAMALICQPRLLILDEPTTGLDVTIQADILDLIVELRAAGNMTICLITHDLGIVAESCDRVAVMRHGSVCETGDCAQVLSAPRHPYTRELIANSQLEDVA
ncbi:ABC transporter ATP-binding protein [Salipiger abyssi]|uniref:ABC transporter ATP-binding protein n=1 Tax=Salipiger abyssi TaxID=1250539 RepID=UPI001A8F398B|nr:ABC transporter ATP-binding protein [Salipiger abyssi]MBN9888191.1 ABC transporter ATP-binding protein [Salipiger abyssi]